MSDVNRELLGRLARRPYEDDDPPLHPPPTLPVTEWNVPIDQIQADCMTEREVIRGIVADYKAVARRWDIPPCPSKVRFP